MDRETKNILQEQKLILEVTNHQGWKVVRKILEDKILGLQNVFDIETATPAAMLRDLQARKKATEILFAFLREVEGARDVVEEQEVKNTHIVNLD